MTGEYNPEYSDVSPQVVSSFEIPTLSHDYAQSQHEMSRRALRSALFVDDNIVLATPETRHTKLESHLRGAIIGQDQAIDAIINAMDRSDVRLDSNRRPLATLAFLGPTGVGKSETAKMLAEFNSEGETPFIKIDCSSFSHGHEVATLTGSPLGYIGSEAVPVLNQRSVQRKGMVILFDEIEKGAHELHDLMLQILDDGMLQLSNGTQVSFREATIIITSNLGADQMGQYFGKNRVGFTSESDEPDHEGIEKSAREAFKKGFRPEFINRIDSVVVFNPLDHDTLSKVLDTKLAVANESYVTTYGVALTLMEGAHNYLVEKALEERGMGARPLVRAFEQDVQSVFGRHLGGKGLDKGTQVSVYHRSECPDNVQKRYPFDELIFTQRFDKELLEKKEAHDHRVAAEQQRRKEVARKAQEKADAERAAQAAKDKETSTDDAPEPEK